ncbi:hypothetical protein COE50_06280 [Bacillus anthracis]|nr:hypothetical protein COE50_06280 [Bacillus anthracis]
MNVIPFENAKRMQAQTMRLPIVERIYKDGEVIKFEVSGEKEIPKGLLKKEWARF